MVDVVSFSVADTTAANNSSNAGISILGTGLVSTADDTLRAIWSIVAKFYDDFGGQSTVGGTGDAITITSTTVYTALASGMRLMFKASAANTGAATLNLDAIGAKAVRKISGGTDVALSANDIPSAGARVDMVYDSAANSAAGAWILISGSGGLTAASNAQAATATSTAVALTPANLAQERGFSNDPFINLSLTCSVGSSALTIALKGQDGNDPSATNPVYVAFRSATAATGQSSQLTVTAATSLVVSSGSTLGTRNGVPATLAIVAFNDAGTFRLGIINPTALPIIDGIASSTAEGGAGAADSAGVYYTGTAVTSKAFTVLGFIVATEATAGTWATAPSTVQVATSPVVSNNFSRLVLGTAVASTSGTSIDYTSIPSWVRRITFSFSGLSTNGTSNVIVQLGSSSGGIETTNYLGDAGGNSTAAAGNSLNMSSGFLVFYTWSAATLAHGAMVLTLIDPATNTWAMTATLGRSDSTVAGFSGGSKALSSTLDRVRLTTTNGTDTFDAGLVNIMYE